ncbi:MAG: ATP-binding protein [Bacteroidales bacterium]
MKQVFIERKISDQFKKLVRPGKVLILLGARRVGKTVLLKNYLETKNKREYLFLNGEDQNTIDLFDEQTVQNYSKLLGNCKLLIIDEAQKIPSIGSKLKLFVDSFPDVSVVATGSSVFDMNNKLGEPLVGRSNVIHLYPFAQMEFSEYENLLQTKEKKEERLIFGSYPELEHFETWKDKIRYLDGIVNNYLLRDILEYNGIKKSDKLMDLLRLIAFQIGKEVNIEELANQLKGISRNTVEHYLDLLSKVFVIYKVRGFSQNLRKEITKTNRWYFYDNGIRNAVIRNFNSSNLRNDMGELWENYLFSERLKRNAYNGKYLNSYFWRTYDQQVIDLVEEESGKLHAYEFKWNPRKKVKAPKTWQKTYPEASFHVVNRNNYLDFIE